MNSFESYRIPADIRNPAFNKDTPQFKELENLVHEARFVEGSYIKLFTALLYMEETANTERVAKFHLQNVELELQSNRIFKINIEVSISTKKYLILF